MYFRRERQNGSTPSEQRSNVESDIQLLILDPRPGFVEEEE